MAETRTSAGMIVDEAKNAALPCELEVQASDRRPLKVETPIPVADGRYKLLAPAWTADLIRVNGEWEIKNLAPHQAKETLTPAERSQTEKHIKKELSDDPMLRNAALDALKRGGVGPVSEPPKPKRRWRL